VIRKSPTRELQIEERPTSFGFQFTFLGNNCFLDEDPIKLGCLNFSEIRALDPQLADRPATPSVRLSKFHRQPTDLNPVLLEREKILLR
jgi:hypothetical protein